MPQPPNKTKPPPHKPRPVRGFFLFRDTPPPFVLLANGATDTTRGKPRNGVPRPHLYYLRTARRHNRAGNRATAYPAPACTTCGRHGEHHARETAQRRTPPPLVLLADGTAAQPRARSHASELACVTFMLLHNVSRPCTAIEFAGRYLSQKASAMRES